MLNKKLIIRLTTSAHHFRTYNEQLELKRVTCLAILKKNELSCDTKEENMDSTEFALDEIFVCIYKIFNKCWIFFTY